MELPRLLPLAVLLAAAFLLCGCDAACEGFIGAIAQAFGAEGDWECEYAPNHLPGDAPTSCAYDTPGLYDTGGSYLSPDAQQPVPPATPPTSGSTGADSSKDTKTPGGGQ